MSVLHHGDLHLTLEPEETVLAALLRAGVAVPNSCRSGACQSCRLRACAGEPPAAAQVGLRPTLRERGYFLACLCRPTEDLTVAVGEDPPQDARVIAVDRLAPEIVRLRLRPTSRLDYRAGQFVTLLREDGLARSYSLASLPADDALELHVRVLPHGRMSRWIADDLRPGDRVRIRGPEGECFYSDGDPAQPLLLVGVGTGLAPLYGVVRDALSRGHTGPITLLHGALTPAGLYLADALGELVRGHENLRYVRCALRGEPDEALHIGSVEAVAAALLPKLAGHRVFLCGDPDRVHALRKQCFLRGARMNQIHADAFVTAPPPEAPAMP
jgi:CDP-4-dehydro-6-deoxyglucose reductase